jgi:hypothetical protein
MGGLNFGAHLSISTALISEAFRSHLRTFNTFLSARAPLHLLLLMNKAVISTKTDLNSGVIIIVVLIAEPISSFHRLKALFALSNSLNLNGFIEHLS